MTVKEGEAWQVLYIITYVILRLWK